MVTARRDFLKMMALAAAAACSGVSFFIQKVFRAARPREWIGRTKSLPRRVIERPGRWAG